GYNLALNGPTMQQQPAIFGWKALDPGVRLKRIDVPAEGRFWLGVRASDNGDGTWDWNLALQNLNSHVSARSFSFTAPPGATLSNLGFHDVAYHSGEPWSGTDWTASVSSNTVTWQTQTFAQDPNANALRWGTTYSFRFTTDVAPTTLASSGSIGLFRPTPNPTVNFTLDPINTLVPLPNVDLKRNVFETFDPIVVRVESATGQPLSGIDVTFSVVGAGASIVGPSVVTSDANGLAQVVVQAGGLSGPVIIDAETTSASVQLTRFVRRFSFNWLPAAGILIFGVQTDEPGMYLTLAFDASSTPVMATPFGLVHTSVVNPGPNFSALSAIFGVGSFDPTLVTSIGGIWTRVFQNAHAFQGSGLDLAIQMYGYYQSPTGGTYWVSNAHQQLF
ncbi:MAG: hypothetical protein KDB53_14195, partial [Planctomycetes bacterium]|nr:hypothetical protein [Planctomycetota bacterium]